MFHKYRQPFTTVTDDRASELEGLRSLADQLVEALRTSDLMFRALISNTDDALEVFPFLVSNTAALSAYDTAGEKGITNHLPVMLDEEVDLADAIAHKASFLLEASDLHECQAHRRPCGFCEAAEDLHEVLKEHALRRKELPLWV